jgi:hypothetical protein
VSSLEKHTNERFSPRRLIGIGRVRCGIDRARRDLLGIGAIRVGIGLRANPFTKYSNPDLRYPTSFKFRSFSEKNDRLIDSFSIV